MTKKPSYKEAITKLEQIVARMEQNDVDIDELQAMLKEAQTLIGYCKEKLYKADKDVKKLLDDFEKTTSDV